MKLTRQTCSTAYHDQSPRIRPPTAAACATTRGQRLLELSHALPRFSTPNSDLSHTHRHDGLLIHQSTWPENLAVIRRYTLPHAPSGYPSRHHAPVHATTRLLRAKEFMLMSSGDVITPSQQPCKHFHISPSPCQRHIIGWHQRLYCSTRDPTRKPGTDLDQYLLTLNLDPLTLTFCVDLWLKLKIFEMAYLAQFFP